MSFLDHPKRLGRLNLIAQLSFPGALLFSICKWSHEVKIPAPGSGLAPLVLRWPSGGHPLAILFPEVGL
jgi:hypothetical protein